MEGFKTTSMRFTSRASVKIGDSYYTFESTIEKQCPEQYSDEEYTDAKQALWDEVNAEVDNQVAEIVNLIKNKK